MGVLLGGVSGGPGTGLIVLGFIVVAGAIGTVVGAVEGAVSALPAATVEEAETSLKGALADLQIQESLKNHMLQAVRNRTSYEFVLLSGHGATEPGEETRYQSFAAEGVNTILEVSVPRMGLTGGFGANPSLAVFMAARARLVSARDGMTLHDVTAVYQSRRRKFTEWAENDANPFRDELERAYGGLAEKIVEDIFLLYVPPATVYAF